jgi:D-mannonate dehydratase
LSGNDDAARNFRRSIGEANGTLSVGALQSQAATVCTGSIRGYENQEVEIMIKKFEPKVFQLGYVALETADIERSKDHYIETIGMTETGKDDGGSVYLSIGYEHHNIVLRRGKKKSLLYLGFQLKPGTI